MTVRQPALRYHGASPAGGPMGFGQAAAAAPVSEQPILMSAPMVRAILAGAKTQTRRLVKPQPVENYSVIGAVRESRGWSWPRPDGQCVGLETMSELCPYGTPGDLLWVRETYALEHCVEPDQAPPHADWRPTKTSADPDEHRWIQPHYRATDPPPALSYEDSADPRVRWRASIHMPRWASRITLRVTGVRVERLQDISREDAVAEGVEWNKCPTEQTQQSMDAQRAAHRIGMAAHYEAWIDYVGGYHWLWESINGAGAWNANPFVWVIEFLRVGEGAAA